MYDLADLIEEKQFLASDFLLWLWYEGDQTDNIFSVNNEAIEVHYDDQLVLEAHFAESEKNSLKGGSPTHAPEARKALQFGKEVSKAKIRLVKSEREWLFVVDAASFKFSAIKLPTILSEQEDDQFYERMYLIEELEVAWFELYRQFLEIRLSETWSEISAKMTAWIMEPTAGP